VEVVLVALAVGLHGSLQVFVVGLVL
jgi:hypothetical protein